MLLGSKLFISGIFVKYIAFLKIGRNVKVKSLQTECRLIKFKMHLLGPHLKTREMFGRNGEYYTPAVPQESPSTPL
jgi:hypothetical protein